MIVTLHWLIATSRKLLPQGPAQWSSFDMRVVLRLIAFLLAWKIVSLDYSGLADVVGRKPLHPLTHAPIQAWASWLHAYVASNVVLVRELQVIAALLLVAGGWLAWRSLIAIGLVIVAAIYLPAVQFSLWFYDIELCWTLLVIAVAWPGSWRNAFGSTRNISPAATALGTSWAVYIAVAYFYCGWSKINLSWRWFLDTDLEMLYPVMQVSHGSTFNWLGMPWLFHQLLLACPWIGQALALVTLLSELGWCLALISTRARRLFPLLMLASHVAIFWTSGILFLQLALLQIAIVVRWRDCFAGNWQASAIASWSAFRTISPRESAQIAWFRGLVPLALALFASIYPTLNHSNTGMLSNWNQFGWSYRGLTQPASYACLGYQDELTGQVERLPLNHAGFLDFRGASGPSEHLNNIVYSNNTQLIEQSSVALKTYLLLLRHGYSNRWLLGPLTCPSHVVCVTRSLPQERLDDLVVLQGKFHFDKSHNTLVGSWRMSPDLPRVSPDRIDMLLQVGIARATTESTVH